MNGDSEFGFPSREATAVLSREATACISLGRQPHACGEPNFSLESRSDVMTNPSENLRKADLMSSLCDWERFVLRDVFVRCVIAGQAPASRFYDGASI